MIIALAATLLVCPLSAFGAPKRTQATLTTVEELPIDKFDEYPAGSFPPAPWQRLKPGNANADFALLTASESPFVGNLATGKGLTMTVTGAKGDPGDGIERKFTPAPPGPEFLGFDFRLGDADGSHTGLDVRCQLLDANGRGLSITMSAASGLIAAGTHVANLIGGQWYHAACKIEGGKIASFGLTPFPQKNPTVECRNIALPVTGPYDTLCFSNSGDATQRGSWSIDNVLMAGQVDAPRNAWWPFDQLPIDALRASVKKVFVYYFPIYSAGPDSEDPSLSWYSRTIMNPTTLAQYHADRAGAGTEFEYCPLPYPPLEKLAERHAEWVRAREHEVRLARQMGIDGFFVDFEAFPSPSGGKYFNEVALSLVEAAQKVDPTFKIVPAIYGPDGVPGGATDEKAVEFANCEIVKQVLTQPNLYRLADGRVVITSYYPEAYPASWWRKAMDELEKNGIKVAFIPQFNSITHLAEFAPISYGMNNWGPRSPGKYDWVERVKPFGVKSVFPIVEQDVRTRGVWYMESCNSSLLRDLWSQTIANNADWAFIDTWSDYTEQAQAPSRSIGYAPFDIDTYYTQWFKTGKQPQIVRDVLYYFYRNQHTATASTHGKPWVLRAPWGENNESTARNEIELLAFLKAPGKLQVQVGKQTFTRDAPAGITPFKVPLPPALAFTPRFTLQRNGTTVVSRSGQYPVLDKPEYGNMMYHSGVISPNAAP